ncbi:hypothetical protein A0H81_10619 [Grifola frondosa]|uniref:Uncharacterized protein n=1 Tax=Grifola frondosa TaxID=5627 RepID=A0A1C7LXJ5_GRIFR|nr:hypothetical protein A0H81_10619 [Grifola frondosa]
MWFHFLRHKFANHLLVCPSIRFWRDGSSRSHQDPYAPPQTTEADEESLRTRLRGANLSTKGHHAKLAIITAIGDHYDGRNAPGSGPVILSEKITRRPPASKRTFSIIADMALRFQC